MTELTSPAEPEEVTAGWLFMTANALGLSDADLAYVLSVRPDTIRKNWKYGTQPIPDGVRTDLEKFIEFTDECVDVIVSRAENLAEPALIVYPNLRDVPEGHRVAFEFRNDSWHVPAIYELLESRNAALVQSESDGAFELLPWTADWAYLRLRRVDYAVEDLRRWLDRLDASGVKEAQVFFKHEDAATGPKLAAQLLEMAEQH